MSLFILEGGILFAHIPKTGGTSIRKDRQLLGAAFYEPPKDWEWNTSFAVVRDVYDRFESAYRDFTYLRGINHDKIEPEDFLLLNFYLNIDDPGSAGHHICPQWHPIHGIQQVDKIYKFDEYKHDRHLRTGYGTPRVKWTPGLRAMVAEYYAYDIKMLELL